MTDFIYEKNLAPCGIAIEEIYGAEEKSPKVWKLFALQIFSESGGDYRSIVHIENGAPLLEDSPQRISVSHTSHHLVVASLPKTPDIDLTEVNERTVMGVDIEKADRAQVIKIRDKFLSPAEEKMVAAEDVKANILAWTCKEALYKSVMGASPDWKEDYQIISLPIPAADIKSATKEKFGKGLVKMADGSQIGMNLSSWQSDGHILTLAFSSKIPMYK